MLFKNVKSTHKRKKKNNQAFFSPTIIQPKLTIGQPNDKYEQDADAMADRVMRMPMSMNEFVSHPNDGDNQSPRIQTKCATCEQEEKLQTKPLLIKPEGGGGVATQALASQLNNTKGGGTPLPFDTNSYMSQAFGNDFSGVRVHTGSNAIQMNQGLNARAFTYGSDIYFNRGQYSPSSSVGKKLLAHELTHVVQQNHQISPKIQRMTIGTGNPPADWMTHFPEYNVRVVPTDDRARVENAITMIRDIANHSEDYEDCIRVFNEHCSGSSTTAFTDTFNNAILWKGDSDGAYARGDLNGNDIFYTQAGYDQGTRGLAQTIIHEMGHNCGVTGGDDHYLAEVGANYCIGPDDEFSFRFGLGLNTQLYSLAFTYRRLFDLALGGQFQFTVGGDIDITGITSSIIGASSPTLSDSLGEFELGSISAGLQGRTNLLWGGESFGGLTLGTEAGFDVGRFRVLRETEPDEFEYGAGFILQSTLGAEFYIPANPYIFQFSLDTGYRFIQPLNAEAQQIHELVFGLTFLFQ